MLVRLLGILASVSASPPSPPLEVDRDRAEVRIPCRFVNPSRVLEVFACHRTGPTHETVLEFDATGPAIYRALLEIGCRNASYWNGTSPGDFERNQGDRLLVLVRWQEGGEMEEHPAEGLLTEGDTGFPALVRGFSFGARGAFKVAPREPGGDDPLEPDAPRGGDEETRRDAAEARETGVPVGVELSLGAALRETQPHSLLTHPTSSARLQPWMLPPFLDSRVVKDHRVLVEKQAPATLILRRLRSERTLVDAARAEAERRGLEGTDVLYGRLEPMAREVDGLKGQYEALLASLRGVLEEGAPRGEEEKRALGARAKGLLARGQWLCARIEEQYLRMYALEEEYKAAWIEKRGDLPPEVRLPAVTGVRDGFRFEPLLAAKRVELAALDLTDPPGPPGEVHLRRQAIAKEMEEIELERSAGLARASVRDTAAKIAQVKPSDPYVARLFEEDLVRERAAVRQFDALRRLARTELEELRGLLDGSWDSRKARVLEEREKARQELEAGKLEEERAQVLEEIRWAEGDAQSGDRERSETGRKKLGELRKKEADLEARLKKAGASPPAQDGK